MTWDMDDPGIVFVSNTSSLSPTQVSLLYDLRQLTQTIPLIVLWGRRTGKSTIQENMRRYIEMREAALYEKQQPNEVSPPKNYRWYNPGRPRVDTRLTLCAPCVALAARSRRASRLFDRMHARRTKRRRWQHRLALQLRAKPACN